MLHTSVFSTPSGTILKLEGVLSGACVDELERCWEILQVVGGGRPISVDLSEVKQIDDRGMELLGSMRQKGVVVVEGNRHADAGRESVAHLLSDH